MKSEKVALVLLNRVGDFRLVERESLAGNAPYTLVYS